VQPQGCSLSLDEKCQRLQVFSCGCWYLNNQISEIGQSHVAIDFEENIIFASNFSDEQLVKP
jgi:hypothetical protein